MPVVSNSSSLIGLEQIGQLDLLHPLFQQVLKDHPEYIVRLVGQVVRVSLETVRLVRSPPEEYSR